jgi:hypothetical protein
MVLFFFELVDGIVDEEDYYQNFKPTKRVQTTLFVTRPFKRRDHFERSLEMTKPNLINFDAICYDFS